MRSRASRSGEAAGKLPNRPDKYGPKPHGWAAVRGNEGIVKLLLEREAVGSDRRDRHGDTPLSYAPKEGHGGIVKLLQARKSVENADAQ